MRAADLARAAIGGMLLCRPRLASGLARERRSSRTDLVVRALAGRMLGQAAAGAFVASARPDRTRLIAGADAVVEALHGASMVGLGVLDPPRRRLAFTGAVMAGTFLLADARASLRRGPASTTARGRVR